PYASLFRFLVVEPGGEEGVQPVVDRHGVKLQAGPGVLAGRLQPVEQLGHRGPRVRLLPRAGAQLHQRVRLLRTGRKRSTRAVILEAAPHQPYAVCQQRRGQRIAGMALIGPAVEGEAEGAAAVDLAAGDAVRLGHFVRPMAFATSRASSTLMTSCVTVLRVTTSQERSPCS